MSLEMHVHNSGEAAKVPLPAWMLRVAPLILLRALSKKCVHRTFSLCATSHTGRASDTPTIATVDGEVVVTTAALHVKAKGQDAVKLPHDVNALTADLNKMASARFGAL